MPYQEPLLTLNALIDQVNETIDRLSQEAEHFQNQYDATISKLRAVIKTRDRLLLELHK